MVSFWNTKYVMVTVGSTSFDDLISAATDRRVMTLFRRMGFQALLLQVGNTSCIPDVATPFPKDGDVELETGGFLTFSYRYSEQFRQDLRFASLVLCHGGAGTIFEALRASRPLIAVPNPSLMGNHQRELIGALYVRKCLYTTTAANLESFLIRLNLCGHVHQGIVQFGGVITATEKDMAEAIDHNFLNEQALYEWRDDSLEEPNESDFRKEVFALLPFSPEVVRHGNFVRALEEKCDLSLERPKRAWIVLGSGGHTTEMIAMLRSIPRGVVNARILIAKTDKGSAAKVAELPALAIRNSVPPRFEVTYIPRAREVHQDWISSFFSTLWSFLFCLRLAILDYPELLIVNGPGTCVPVAMAAWVLRWVFYWKKCRIVYVESIARVNTISLAGRSLRRIVDRFFVQWPDIVKREEDQGRAVKKGRGFIRRRKAEFHGLLF